MPKSLSFVQKMFVSTPQLVDGPAILSPVPVDQTNHYETILEPTAPADKQETSDDGIRWAFWVTRLILDVIWLITPLSFLLAGWCISALIRRYRVIAHSILLASCVPEICFAFYQQYLIRRASRYYPVSVMTPDERLRAQHVMFHSHLRPRLNSARSGGLTVAYNDPEDDKNVNTDVHSRTGKKEIRLRYECLDKSMDDTVSKDTQNADFRRRYGIWFDNAPWEVLRRDNVLDWLSWMYFYLPLETTLQCHERTESLHMLYQTIENRSGVTFPPGVNPSVKVSRLTLDPLGARVRPLIINGLSNIINWYIRNMTLPALGMMHHIQGDMEYMIRIPQGWTPGIGRTDPQAIPVMYLHGLGFGLIQNLSVLKPLLTRLPTHPILFPIAHHTTQSVLNGRHLRPWTRKGFTADIQAICDRWGFGPTARAGSDESSRDGGLSVISHSNGSVHHGWLVKDCPGLIRRHVFVDPIIFCLDEGFTCHAFCYRKPNTSFQLLLQRLVASEVGISSYIQRHFHWSDNCLYVEDFPELLDPSIARVFLGKKDVVVVAPRIREYLESHGATLGENLCWSEEGGHGAALRSEGLEAVMSFASHGLVARPKDRSVSDGLMP